MTQKIVINACFGGFSLSRAAVRRLAELQGRPCYFYDQPGFSGPFVPLADDAKEGLIWWALDIPNPNDVLSMPDGVSWAGMTMDERGAHNALRDAHTLPSRPKNRADPLLVQVVEELGKAADGPVAELRIVEIPDGVAWEIKEHDGSEHVAEVHRTWR